MPEGIRPFLWLFFRVKDGSVRKASQESRPDREKKQVYGIESGHTIHAFTIPIANNTPSIDNHISAK